MARSDSAGRDSNSSDIHDVLPSLSPLALLSPPPLLLRSVLSAMSVFCGVDVLSTLVYCRDVVSGHVSDWFGTGLATCTMSFISCSKFTKEALFMAVGS